MRLYRDYFSERPTYHDKFFRRRFRMRRSISLQIVRVVEEHDNYFVQRRNTVEALGFSCLQKVTAAYRQLTYAVLADYVYEYVRIGESTTIKCLRRYVGAVCEYVLIMSPFDAFSMPSQPFFLVTFLYSSRLFLSFLDSLSATHFGSCLRMIHA
jgi:hypothetical protein